MLKTLRHILTLILLVHAPTLAQAPQPNSVRGVWVVRHQLQDSSSIRKIFEVARENAFSDLFIQVRGRGDAYYTSNSEPRAEELSGNWDPLAYVLSLKKNYRVRVHAWVNTFYIWSAERLPRSPMHVLRRHPEWLARPVGADVLPEDSLKSRLRNEEGLYLSPLLPEVHDYLLQVYDELLSRYPQLDGLHLDYIRYPGENFGWHPVGGTQFEKRYYVHPRLLKEDPDAFARNFGPTGYEIYFSRWGTFLRENLSLFVERLALHVQKTHPNVILSAAVKPDPTIAHWRFYQEWDYWLDRGWLDWALPMNYAVDMESFAGRMEAIAGVTGNRGIVMGVALYNQPPEAAIAKVERVVSEKLPGVVLFSYDQFIKDSAIRELYRRKILRR
ncbi:MAG TPA: family 10 glycosylhydrolase [Calditrichia bacterium]|nr:family 10 glycosylhydrolase [Calditrichota bacterium]HQU72801.1 family 10 glycosylhydrolase [Calditrichia bacterium]HQV33337.1 family 10 glycosylhydrolase [Calditrichia bacterium]